MWIHAFTTVNKCSCFCGYGTSRCPEIGRCDIKHDWNLQVVGTIVLIQTSVSVACLYLCCYGVVLNFVKARVSIQSALQLHIPDNGLAVKKILTPKRKTYQHAVQGKTLRRHYQTSHSIVLSRASLSALSVLGYQDCRIQPWNVDHPISL